MVDKKDIKERIRKIYDVLPKLNDQRCGYRTCGEFARAVAEGKALCYGCVSGGPQVAAKVCEIMGFRVAEEATLRTSLGRGLFQLGFPGVRGMGSWMGGYFSQDMERSLARGRGVGKGRGGRMRRGFGRGRRWR